MVRHNFELSAIYEVSEIFDCPHYGQQFQLNKGIAILPTSRVLATIGRLDIRAKCPVTPQFLHLSVLALHDARCFSENSKLQRVHGILVCRPSTVNTGSALISLTSAN